MFAPLSRSAAAVLGAGFISLCALPSAHADLHLAVGTRFEPLRYTSAYFPSSNLTSATPSLISGGRTDAFQSTSLSPYLGLFIAQRYGIMAAVDIGYAKLGGELQGPSDAMPTKDNNSYFQFGFSVGFKLYLTQPKANKVVPYVYTDFFKYFASISTENTTITGEQAAAQAAMRSPIGWTAAFGAEYFLGSGFSLGSEIFGLRVSNVSGEYREAPPAPPTRHSLNYTQVALYTGITLNYRFQVSASVKSTDDDKDGDDKPARRRTDFPPPPPTPPPPPPTPEAVD
jgi:hypothetical protein